VAKGWAKDHVAAKGQAKSHVVAKGWAKGHVVAKGRTKGHVVADGQAKGNVVAKGLTQGHIVAKGQAKGRIVAKGRAKGKAKGRMTIRRLRLDDGVTINLHLPFTLTKFSAIFAEAKGYFRVTTPKNQHRQRSSCSLRMQDQSKINNQPEVITGEIFEN
jgi:hypothetical protein